MDAAALAQRFPSFQDWHEGSSYRFAWPTFALALFVWLTHASFTFGETRLYSNQLKPAKDPTPILADFPQYVEPIRERARLVAPALVDEPGGNLSVRAWRFSYNARAIIEMPNRLRGDRTAVIVVHPWGIDDGWGWVTPEPAGAGFQCTPKKNAVVAGHIRDVIDPLLTRLRPSVRVVAYSLPGAEDPIRKKIYSSVRARTNASDRAIGIRELEAKLAKFPYRGEPLPATIALSSDQPVRDYFRAFPGLDASARYNHAGFWELPIPVAKGISVALDDVVIYDAEGYDLLRDFLKKEGVQHVLLTGYNTDMCFCLTTAGYKNLSKDFNVFLVGDATQATFPANPSSRFATNAAISFAALDQLVTQCGWIKVQPNTGTR